MLSLAEAAALAGVSKSTLFRAVRAGRVSAQRSQTGHFELDPAEVARVFPPRISADRISNEPLQRDASTDELIRELRAVIADLRGDRDHWRGAFETMQRALPAPAEQPATADEAAATPAAGPWRRTWRWLRASG